MSEELPSNPHNNLFVTSMSRLAEARSLIETQLPPAVIQDLDLDSLQLESETFVDAQLRDSFADVLYSVRLKQPIGDVKHVFIYLLFEHKSQMDRLTALQLLRYIVRIWEKCLRDDLPLCPVFPFVVYHGPSRWTAPTSIDELIPTPESMQTYAVQFQFPLLDLNQTPKDRLVGIPFLRNMLFLLKYGRGPDLPEVLVELFEFLRDPATNAPDQDRLETVWLYIMAVNNSIDADKLNESYRKVFPFQIEPGSIADRLLNEGRQEGRQEGREEGRQEGREEGRQEGREEGRQEGTTAGKIQLLQQLLGEPETPLEELVAQSPEALLRCVEELRERIRGRSIL